MINWYVGLELLRTKMHICALPGWLSGFQILRRHLWHLCGPRVSVWCFVMLWNPTWSIPLSKCITKPYCSFFLTGTDFNPRKQSPKGLIDKCDLKTVFPGSTHKYSSLHLWACVLLVFTLGNTLSSLCLLAMTIICLLEDHCAPQSSLLGLLGAL